MGPAPLPGGVSRLTDALLDSDVPWRPRSPSTRRDPEFVRDVIDSGRIQKFEYCVELVWKQVRSSLLADGLDVPIFTKLPSSCALMQAIAG